MSRQVVASLALATTLAIGIAAAPVESVSITSTNGAIGIREPVSAGDRVSLVFTNSMFGGDVRETFDVSDGSLVRSSFVTENAASAEYYAWNAAIEATGDGFEVILPPARFASIPVLIDDVGNYRLVVGDRETDLSALVTSPTSVRIEVVTEPLVLRVFGGC